MQNDNKSCCFTGYRPGKFPFPLESGNADYINFENRLTDTIFELIADGCRTFYSGVAMGFDIIAVECVLTAKQCCADPIKLICAVPFIEQSAAFPQKWKSRYDAVLSAADEVILISDSYYSGCYFKRNKFMVENSDYVVTWFDGKTGGTKNTVDYARRLGRTVVNLNEAAAIQTDFKDILILEDGKPL